MNRSAIGKHAALAALLAHAVLSQPAYADTPPETASSDSLMSRLRATAGAAADSTAEAEADSLPAAAAAVVVAPDTSVYVTGTRVRFGLSIERLQNLGVPLATSKQRGRRGETVRESNLRWFGAEATTTLFFRSNYLVRAAVVVPNASPRTLTYIEDQLRLSGLKRQCERNVPGSSDCEWRGPTVMRLVVQGSRVDATIEPAPRPRPAPPPTPVRLLPDVFVLEKGVSYDVPLPEFALRPSPVRPTAPAASGVMGRVWVRSHVDTAGTALDPQIVKGIAPLDSAAITAARGTRFKPYVIDGVTRSITVEFPVVFTLN